MSDSEEYEYEYDESDQVSGSLRVGALTRGARALWMLLIVACALNSSSSSLRNLNQEQMDADTAEEESFQYTGG